MEQKALLRGNIHIILNPYVDMIPHEDFFKLVAGAIAARADDIARRFVAGEYPRNSMGFVVLDRTAPLWKPSDKCVLIVAAIGDEGKDFVSNAMAKAVEHRDHGVDCGILVYTQKGRLAEGDFRYGFSVCIDGLYVGGSAQSELQDRYQCTLLAADINYRVDGAIKAWEEKTGPGRWYSNENLPGKRYADPLALAAMKSFDLVMP